MTGKAFESECAFGWGTGKAYPRRWPWAKRWGKCFGRAKRSPCWRAWGCVRENCWVSRCLTWILLAWLYCCLCWRETERAWESAMASARGWCWK